MWRSDFLLAAFEHDAVYRGGVNRNVLTKFLERQTANFDVDCSNSDADFPQWHHNQIQQLQWSENQHIVIVRPFGEEAYFIANSAPAASVSARSARECPFTLDKVRNLNFVVDASKTFAFKLHEAVRMRVDMERVLPIVMEWGEHDRRSFGADSYLYTRDGFECMVQYAFEKQLDKAELHIHKILFDDLTLVNFAVDVVCSNIPDVCVASVDAILRGLNHQGPVAITFKANALGPGGPYVMSAADEDGSIRLVCDTTPETLIDYGVKIAVLDGGNIYALESVLKSARPQAAIRNDFEHDFEDAKAITASKKKNKKKKKHAAQDRAPTAEPTSTTEPTERSALHEPVDILKNAYLVMSDSDKMKEASARREAAENAQVRIAAMREEVHEALSEHKERMTVDEVCMILRKHQDIFKDYPLLRNLLQETHQSTMKLLISMCGESTRDLERLAELLLRTDAGAAAPPGLDSFLTTIMDKRSSES